MLTRLAAVALGSVLSAQAFAWGMLGHETINAVAAAEMTGVGSAFFQANADHLESFASVPDRYWRMNPTGSREAPLHFFHWDFYNDSVIASRMPVSLSEAAASFSKAELNDNGKGLWRIEQMFAGLVDSLRASRCEEAIQIAGTMGHYVADLSQPMHVTADYDGQSIGRRGIHSHFETKLVTKIGRDRLMSAIRKELRQGVPGFDAFLPIRDLTSIGPLIYHEAEVSIGHMPRLLAIYRSGSNTSAEVEKPLMQELPAHMARGVFILQKLWQAALSMSASSGGRIRCAGQHLDVPRPQWISFDEEGWSEVETQQEGL